MEPSVLFEWALYIGLAVVVFNAITGFDEFLYKLISQSSTKKYLVLKVEQLDNRVKELELSK
jgi:hypothetical protein